MPFPFSWGLKMHVLEATATWTTWDPAVLATTIQWGYKGKMYMLTFMLWLGCQLIRKKTGLVGVCFFLLLAQLQEDKGNDFSL